MFPSLGLQNARRYLNRTLLATAVIAGAAIILTAALSTRSGFLHSTQLYLRGYLGADIVVLPGTYAFAEGDFSRSSVPWAWQDYGQARNELPGSLLRLMKDGFLTTPDQPEQIDMSKLARVLEAHPEVVATYPYYYLPGIAQLAGRDGAIALAMPVRGRDTALDQHWDLEFTVKRGGGLQDFEAIVTQALVPSLEQIRQLSLRDGELVCMLNSATIPEGVQIPSAGSTLTVEIPAYDYTRQAFDFSRLHSFSLQVIGHYNVPVNSYPVSESAQAPFYWTNASLHLPLTTWQNLAREVGAPTSPMKLNQVGLLLSNTVHATRLARELRAELPGYTVLTVQEMASLIPRVASQAGVPINMDQAIHVMTLLITSSIVAANAFLLVMQRRKEMAILKSLGASTWNIITMVLTELAAVSFVASLGGTLLYRVFFAISMLYNQVPWALVWRSSLLVAGQVTLTLCLSTVVFGLAPAVKAALTPVMEVMRDA